MVLYEALTGKTAFLGETVSDTLVAILEREPDWQRLPPGTPALIRSLLRRCLTKNPEHRVHDIADARIEIEEAAKEPAGTEVVSAAAVQRSELQRTLPWALACLMAVMAILSLWNSWGRRPTEPKPLVRTSIPLPAEQDPFLAGSPPMVSVSPEGTRIVYTAMEGDQRQLYMRDLDRDDPTPIPGTEDGQFPFFSPDGRWIGFFAGGSLKKVSLEGIGAIELCQGVARGGSWGPDGIVFTEALRSGLTRISSEGGIPEVLTTLDPDAGERSHRWPHVLPDGKGIIFSVSKGGSYDDCDIVVQSLETGARRVLTQGACAIYAPTGHLVYARAGTLYAMAFDAERLEARGPGLPIQEGVLTESEGPGCAHFSFSTDGTLVYVPSPSTDRRLVFVDPHGKAEALPAPTKPYRRVRSSPDGRYLAASSMEHARGEFYLYELGTERLSLLLSGFRDDSGMEWTPDGGLEWTRDGRLLAIAARASGSSPNLFVTPIGGNQAPEHIFPGPNFQLVDCWTPDGKRLLYTEQDPETDWDVLELSLGETEVTSRAILEKPGTQAQPSLSPDGRWLAYTSTESGRAEVYVMPYDGPGRARQLSVDGGMSPVWAPGGRTVYYRNGNQMMEVDITTERAFSAGKPRALFEGDYETEFPANPRHYDISPDGARFVMIQPVGETNPRRIHVAQNWFEELKRLVSVQ